MRQGVGHGVALEGSGHADKSWEGFRKCSTIRGPGTGEGRFHVPAYLCEELSHCLFVIVIIVVIIVGQEAGEAAGGQGKKEGIP